jgi:enterochelin esterase family protein
VRGRIDTISVESASLHRTYPVYVYLPPGGTGGGSLPTIVVTDGGDYLTLGGMDRLLDGLIAAKTIRSVVGVFVDPRTDPRDAASNKRMTDYAASDAYLDFLQLELSPLVEKRYGTSRDPRDRLILGASMGGLISTYAVLTRPGFFAACAAQSPAYWQADSTVVRLANRAGSLDGEFYLQTGTMHDTEKEARLVSRLLRERRARVTFEEFHEGHNWTNWRDKHERILKHYFPVR